MLRDEEIVGKGRKEGMNGGKKRKKKKKNEEGGGEGKTRKRKTLAWFSFFIFIFLFFIFFFISRVSYVVKNEINADHNLVPRVNLF